MTLGGADGITIIDDTTNPDTPVLTVSGFRTEFVNASGTLSAEIDSDIVTHAAISNAHHAKSTLTKNISVEDPTSTEDIGWFRTSIAITVTDMRAVLRGSATPSVTISGITHDPDRNAIGNNVVTSGVEITSVNLAQQPPLEGDVTIPADSWIWFETEAQSGTVDELLVSIIYTED